jgi:hypothetical protein
VPLIRAFSASPNIVRLLLKAQWEFPVLLVRLFREPFDLPTDEDARVPASAALNR